MGIGWIPLVLATGFGLQPTGTFHGDEPVARSGERWLAVENTPTGLRLAPTRVRLDRVVDEIVDGPGEATGQDVVAIDVPHAAMLLRGPGLRAGPVEAGEIVDDESLPPEVPAAFRFRGAAYRIQPDCPAALPVSDSPQTCRMMLIGGRAPQALFEVSRWRDGEGRIVYGDAAHRQLIHIADFDRDGRPDLILDTADHYNASQPTLFLSAPAAKDEAVKQVALHRSTGC